MEEFKGMIMPAMFEDLMQDYEDQLKHHLTDKYAVKRKILDDVVHIMKQFGYDSGAKIFERIFEI